MTKLNQLASKAIENARSFCNFVYCKEEKEDKFEYFSAVLNLEFIVVDKLTKWVSEDPRERIDKTKEALDTYKKLERFINEFMEFKKFSSVEEIEN
jgi:hypothetical protein